MLKEQTEDAISEHTVCMELCVSMGVWSYAIKGFNLPLVVASSCLAGHRTHL